jgi:hypothetical protein
VRLSANHSGLLARENHRKALEALAKQASLN